MHLCFCSSFQLERAHGGVSQDGYLTLTGILTKSNPLSRLQAGLFPQGNSKRARLQGRQLEIAWLGSSCKVGFRIPDFPRLG